LNFDPLCDSSKLSPLQSLGRGHQVVRQPELPHDSEAMSVKLLSVRKMRRSLFLTVLVLGFRFHYRSIG
jgi:hypothetical protein